ncbi:MAG: glycosyltransferase [Acutalibacteraceae bacterium]
MKKKILFVINSMGCGGAEKSIVSLLSLFDFEKYDVDLQMFSVGGMFLKHLAPQVNILKGIDYMTYCDEKGLLNTCKLSFIFSRLSSSVALRINGKTGKLHDAQCFWKYAEKNIKPLEKEYDAAIAWGQGNPTHFVASKVNAKKKIAFINADYLGMGHNRDFDYKYYEKYDYIAAVSDELSGIIKNVYPEFEERIRTVYDINNAYLIEKMASEENPFSDVRDKVKIVTVGRLVKPKGYDIAVEAARVLRDKGISFVWYFVGGGPEMTEIKESIRANGLESFVFPVGEKENPYVYMKNADIYVQTSRREGYCLTLYEARVLNKPCVSTCFDVVYNQLTDGENGIITGMDGQAVADGIIKLIESDELRNKIVENVKKEKKGNVEKIEMLYDLIEK